jgi:hypothetical protein
MTDIRSPSYQAGIRAKHSRERFDFVLGKEPTLKSGKSKYHLLNFVGLKEAYEKALVECPIAADAILVLIWDAVVNYDTMEFLAKDFENKEQEKTL